MASRTRKGAGAIGFRVKTGYAIAVLLAGPVSGPRVLQRRQVILCNPKGFYTRQPYHAELDLGDREAGKIIERSTKLSRTLANEVIAEMVRELAQAGYKCHGVGLAVGSLIDPETLGNEHMRAHALEGRLYRVVLEEGARARRLPHVALVEREAYQQAAPLLRCTPNASTDCCGARRFRRPSVAR